MLMQEVFDRYNLNGYFRSLLVLPVGYVYYDKMEVEEPMQTYYIPFYDDTVELTVPPLNYRVYDQLVNNDGRSLHEEWANVERYLIWFQNYFGVV